MPSPNIQETYERALRHHQSGQLREAEALYRQILARRPHQPEVLHLLGVIAQHQGDAKSALDFIRRAIALKPDFPEAHGNLGTVLRSQGRLDESIAAFRRAIGLKAKFPEALNNLGNALKDRSVGGDLDQATAAYLQAIALQPDYPDAYNNLGVALTAKGEFEQATTAFRRAIELRPAFPAAFANLANALCEMHRPDDAIAAYRQAIALQPDQADVHNTLGSVLRGQGRLDEALAGFRQAIVVRPDFAVAHSNAGDVLGAMGRLDEAADACRRAIALQPGLAEAHSNLGVALRGLGRFDEAAGCFRRALAINPKPHTYDALVSTGQSVASSAELERLAELVDRSGMPVDDRIHAGFALGKSLDEARRFDEAFACFARANQLFKESRAAAGVQWDGDELRRGVNRMIRYMTPEFFAKGCPAGDASELPVFIVGMPRSGTSLVEQIAASHPAVFGGGELDQFQSLFETGTLRLHTVAEQVPPAAASPLSDPQWLADAARAYLDHLRSIGGAATRVTDKLPANVFHLGLIAALFPRARVIICRRDARDCCLSCYFTRFANNNLLYTYDLADCAVQQRETDRLIDHWLGSLPLRMLEIRYETFVTDPETQSRRLIDYLGLSWNSSCLEFHRTQRPVLTASAWQVRQPIYTQSVGRWRHYQRHLGPLLASLNEPP